MMILKKIKNIRRSDQFGSDNIHTKILYTKKFA